jgi:hypothetical protein
LKKLITEKHYANSFMGFSRIKPEQKQHVVLETPMEEPAWNLLAANLPDNLKWKNLLGIC